MRQFFDKGVLFVQDNKLYMCIWLFAVMFILVYNFNSYTTHKFVGVTDSKEVNINLKHAVLVKNVNIIPGQSVKQGQLLVELEREDLTQEINVVEHNLEELYSQFKLNSEVNS